MGHLESNKGNEYPLSKTEGFVVQKLKGETLVYNLETNKAICLNETSAIVWEMCDGKTSVPKIAEKITKKLRKPVAEDLIWLAIDQLKQEDMVDNSSELYKAFEGLSRREIIRKVGFASVVAMPIISSVVAPSAAAAQSGGVAPFDCSDPNNLGTGCIHGSCFNLQISLPAAFASCAITCNGSAPITAGCANNSATAINCAPLTSRPGSRCDCVCA